MARRGELQTERHRSVERVGLDGRQVACKIAASNKGLKMATWKRLTNVNDQTIDVNTEDVAYMRETEGAQI